MGRIQSSIGLVTGTDIVGTVDKLISLSGKPRDRLVSKGKEIQGQQQQISSLTATVIGVQLAGDSLGSASLFRSKSATSSNDAALSVRPGENAVDGNYTVHTLQTAATHNVQSAQRFNKKDEALGLSGKLTINPSGFVDKQVSLASLNGGLGVQAGRIRLTDRSGASAEVDLTNARTIDDVLTAINDAGVDIQATTSDGKIRLIDKSGKTDSNLKVQQLGNAETAADLGLWGIDEAASSVDGKTIDLPDGTASLRGASLGQLGGGTGLGTLTNFDIELSNGSTANIDVSSASSLGEVIDAINGSGLDLIARINDAGNGIRLRDVSAGAGSFSINSGDDTAAKLGIAATADKDVIEGVDLNLQSVTLESKLADLNHGRGIGTGSFTITDSAGNTGAINITADKIETIGDLVDKLNALSINVTAAINEAGDGIVINDGAAGAGKLTIADTGSGKVAKNLGIAGSAAAPGASALTGSEATTIEITAEDTLDSIVEKINHSGRYADASATANDDGTFSLQIRANKGGEAGRIGINTTDLALNLRTASQGRDAVISIAANGGSTRFLKSSDGVFKDSASGLDLTVKDMSATPITVKVEEDPSKAITAIKRFADQFNKLVDKINEVTFFDAEKKQVGLLFGSTETLRIQNGYSRLLTSSLAGAGEIKSLAQIGVRLDETGKMKVDETKLKAALATNTADVEQFFNRKDPITDKNIGMTGQLRMLADRYAGTNGGMLINKSNTLNVQLERNGERVEAMNVRLDAQRERLLKSYYSMEQAIAKIQSNSQYASNISYIGFD